MADIKADPDQSLQVVIEAAQVLASEIQAVNEDKKEDAVGVVSKLIADAMEAIPDSKRQEAYDVCFAKLQPQYEEFMMQHHRQERASATPAEHAQTDSSTREEGTAQTEEAAGPIKDSTTDLTDDAKLQLLKNLEGKHEMIRISPTHHAEHLLADAVTELQRQKVTYVQAERIADVLGYLFSSAAMSHLAEFIEQYTTDLALPAWMTIAPVQQDSLVPEMLRKLHLDFEALLKRLATDDETDQDVIALRKSISEFDPSENCNFVAIRTYMAYCCGCWGEGAPESEVASGKEAFARRLNQGQNVAVLYDMLGDIVFVLLPGWWKWKSILSIIPAQQLQIATTEITRTCSPRTYTAMFNEEVWPAIVKGLPLPAKLGISDYRGDEIDQDTIDFATALGSSRLQESDRDTNTEGEDEEMEDDVDDVVDKLVNRALDRDSPECS